MSHPTRRLAVLGALAAAVPGLLGCGAGDPARDPARDPSTGAASAEEDADRHGDVAGAEELAEAPLGLTTVDPAGAVRHLDLLTEEVSRIGDVGRVTGLDTDGRYLLAQRDDGVAVVDSGVWTWDHVDHFHYYRAEPRVLGVVPGQGRAAVATTTSSTSGGTGLFFAGSGEAVRLDTEALSEGELVEQLRVEGEPHDGMAVPVGDATLVTRPGPDGEAARVVALDADGEELPGTATDCRRASGTITTRVGAVVGCADGALLATVEDGRLRLERVDHPAGTTAPAATTLAGRDGRPTVAGLADERRVWLLDTRAREWRLLRSPLPLVQVTAVDDDEEHVLGLTTDGRVAVLDGVSGRLISVSRPLAARSLRTGSGEPVLVVDQQRAYLSAPAERRLHEIDFADGARVARTFTTPTTPALVAGTGR